MAIQKIAIRKTIGLLLIMIGLAALFTPFTPGSWLIFVGLELLGFRMVFWNKIKAWFSTKGGSVSGGQKHDSRQTK
ncbi:MAG: PGPGW domain-containing protein [bacterium]|nr:PGPGW domain-containing protein [bacterium]